MMGHNNAIDQPNDKYYKAYFSDEMYGDKSHDITRYHTNQLDSKYEYHNDQNADK